MTLGQLCSSMQISWNMNTIPTDLLTQSATGLKTAYWEASRASTEGYRAWRYVANIVDVARAF